MPTYLACRGLGFLVEWCVEVGLVVMHQKALRQALLPMLDWVRKAIPRGEQAR
jgi:hypothetical protein